VLSCDFPEATPEVGLLRIYDRAAMALGAAVLAHNTAGETVRNPGQDKQGNNSPATPFRAQNFTSASSLGIAFSSSASARGLLSG